MFIAFEGVDGAGKTGLSLGFCQYLNERVQRNLRPNEEAPEYVWRKEPEFTSEEADRLNHPSFTDPNKREALFLASRIKNQYKIVGNCIVCDRYVWSALAYSRTFSPEIHPFLKEIYMDPDLFVVPDLYVFVDTNIDQCAQRIRQQDRSTLLNLWKSYELTEKLIECPIVRVNSELLADMSEEQSSAVALQDLIERFEKHLELMEP